MTNAMTVTDAVTTRRSVREFLDKPVDYEVIRRVMDTARWAASGCNFQPWEASIVTGQPLKDLQAKITTSAPQAAEYDWTAPGTEEAYKERLNGISAGMFGAMGIARDDGAARMAAMMRNATSFDAPCVMFIYFPRLMKEPQWSDTGMWLQTVALLLRDEVAPCCTSLALPEEGAPSGARPEAERSEAAQEPGGAAAAADGGPNVARTRRASDPACTTRTRPPDGSDGSTLDSGNQRAGSCANAAVSAAAMPSMGWKVRSSRATQVLRSGRATVRSAPRAPAGPTVPASWDQWPPFPRST